MGSNLDRFFSRMGARVKVMEAAPSPLRMRWNRTGSTEQPPQIVIHIRRDKAGEFFEIRTAPGSRQEIDVLNLQPREKHLVLLSRQFDAQDELLAKQKFLCGRDEKHWFVAAIPGNEPVSTVIGAKIAPNQKKFALASRRWESPARRVSGERMQPTCARESGFFFVSRM